MTQKLLCFLLALALLLSLAPAALAAEIGIVSPEGEGLIELIDLDATQPAIDPEDAAANERTIYEYLIGPMGLNTAAACGILANIWCESGFDPHATGDGGTSYGICQWHNERWDSLKAYCDQHGLDWTTLEGQLPFLQYELTSYFPGLCATLAAAEENPEGAYDAGYAWCYSFERPYDYPNVSVTRGNAARTTYWPKYVTPFGSLPEAALDEAAGGVATIRFRGWAIDPDAPGEPVTVRVFVGGTFGSGARGYTLKAGEPRPDVGAAHPGAGDDHGFSAELTVPERGPQTLYVYACDRVGGYPAKLIATVNVTITAPAAELEPPLLSLDGMSTAGAALSWTAVDGATVYELLRYGSDGPTLVSTDRNAFLDNDVRMGETYTYSVRAFTAGAWTGYGTDLELVFKPFSDVSGKKTTEYIAWAFNNGVVNGTSATTFSPDAPCTRAQFVMMLWKLHGSPEVAGENPFADVRGAKTTRAILWALDAGAIVQAERFHPNDNISRAQIVMILWKLAGCPETEGESPFTDVTGAKTNKAVLWAYQNEITRGTSDASFSPDDDCTRVQLVIFLYKYNELFPVI